ncbi:hypothetical protein UR09_00725 [Candidatus Nitromaritima sp. SCGC AAA799-A02]|nr:hypothetical protein UR09_00725 [Candidatus Nitromaritima sp. SCGC AAA799-A02]
MKTSSRIAAWLASFFALSGLFIYAVAPDRTTPALALLGLTILNILFLCAVERKNIVHIMKTRTALHGANSLVLISVFLGILIFVNLIAFRHKHRMDFTETGFYTLSPQTRKIVESLPREIKMTAFFQTESPEKVSFQDRAQGFLELSDKIELSFVDPDKNPAITKQYGVTTYGTVVLESGKKESKVKDPSEENLVNGILKVIKDEQKVIRFLEGHGEKRIEDQESQGLSTVKAALERDGFKVEKLLLVQAGEIPVDTQLLIIPGPEKPVLAEEQNIIETYLDQGGSVLLLLDPQSRFGMEALLKRWGIETPDSLVIDPMSKLFGGDYAAPVVSQYTVHDITRDFVLPTIFPLLRPVKPGNAANVETTQFLLTGANSWGETDMAAINRGKTKFDEGADLKGPVPVAVIATREISATEENKKPADEKKDPDESKKSIKKARLVVIGDSDFAGNKYFNFSGNGDLFLNTASYLANEENLISIRPKERKNSPLSLTRAQGTFFLMLGILIPGGVVFAGIRTWWRRRRL